MIQDCDRFLTILLRIYFLQKDEIPADPEIGRALMDVMAVIPKIDEEAFEKMLNSSRKVNISATFEFL